MQRVQTSQDIVDENLAYTLFSWSMQGTLEPLCPLYGPQSEPMIGLTGACRARGVDIMTRFNWLFVTPPLVISREDLLWGLDVIDEALCQVDASLHG